MIPPPSAAGVKSRPERVSFAALGTQCEIQYVAPDAKTGKAFAAAAVAWVNRFEAKYSRFRPDSLISRINAAAGKEWVEVDADAESIFALADQIQVLTRGVLDPSMLPLMRLWNYRAAPPRLPTSEEVAAARAKVGWARVQRKPGRVFLPEAGMGLDLGGYGKEYAVDRVAELGLAMGVKNLLVDFGHDVRACGAPPDAPCWLIGVEDPRRLGTSRMTLAVSERGVASSGNGIRCFTIGGRRYGHIVDPRTGYPAANGCEQVTIVASSCLEAGLLATAVYVLGAVAGLGLLAEFFGAEGLIIGDDRELQTRAFCQYVI